MAALDVPVVLFRLSHTGSLNRTSSPTPSSSEQGLDARNPNAAPTPQLLRCHINKNARTETCWTSFATWSATISRLQTWDQTTPDSRPRNLRLHAIFTHALNSETEVISAGTAARGCGIPYEKWMRGEWLVRGHIDAAAFLLMDLDLESYNEHAKGHFVDFRLVPLPVNCSQNPFRNRPRAQPGVLHVLPAALVRGEPSRCYFDWKTDFEQARGDEAARNLLCFVDAIASEEPKTLADFYENDFESVMSEEGLQYLSRT